MAITSARLSQVPGVRHGFFTRAGGISTGIFAELNCGGRGTAEPEAVVDENRRRVAVQLDIVPASLVSVHQVHGPGVVTVDRPWEADARPKADAMVTRRPGIGLGILTADCAPVLFADARAGVVGAAHAGWKGAFAGVLQATVAAMEALGARHEHIVAAVGPAIAQPSYEVDAVFRARFIEKEPQYARFFSAADSSGHYLFQLPEFVEFQLAVAGITMVDQLSRDTYREEEYFFSYRRSVHRGEPDYGRQISVIALAP